MTLDVFPEILNIADIPDIPHIPDTPTITKIPRIIQISSSLCFQKCMTFGVCLSLLTFLTFPYIALFLKFPSFQTLTIYYHTKSEGPSSEIG